MKLIFLFIFNSVDAQLMGQLCAQCTLQIVISVVDDRSFLSDPKYQNNSYLVFFPPILNPFHIRREKVEICKYVRRENLPNFRRENPQIGKQF